MSISFGTYSMSLAYLRERFNFSKRSELHSGSVVDLRAVEALVVNVILDMFELTSIGLSTIGTLAGFSYPTRSWS